MKKTVTYPPEPQLRIEWIGTGAGLNPLLGNTAFLVKGDASRTLLVDCGCTVPVELLKRGQLESVTDIIITHTHSDHIGGLEALALMNYFVWRRRGDDRPCLHLATKLFARSLWEHSLRGGLEAMQNDLNEPFCATLDSFFKIVVGRVVSIPGLPAITFVPTLHAISMENYGLYFDNGIYYSGDTVEAPPSEPRIIFQDCQFRETPDAVHISYQRLKKDLSPETKAKTHLVHLSGGWKEINPIADGFAGILMPGDRFEV